MKLKHTELRGCREELLQQQRHQCALCLDLIDGDAVLDHDHKTGLVRQVLHRGCNALLGKVENNLARNRMNEQRLRQFSSRLVEYITTTHTDFVHPTFLTEEERKMKAKRGRGRGKPKPKR